MPNPHTVDSSGYQPHHPRAFALAMSLLKSRTAAVGVLILFILLMLAVFAGPIAPQDPTRQSLRDRLVPPAWQTSGTTQHLLGTDQLGRDILSRLIYGTRISVFVGLSVLTFSTAIGAFLGLIAGYYGGRIDAIVMRVVDVFLAFPFLLLAIVFMATLGPSLSNVIFVLSITGWVDYARVVRAQVLSVREREYVNAAAALGNGDLPVILRHVLPNIAASIIVIASLQLGTVIIAEASLTFLGLGVPPSIPTWGGMLATGRDYMALAWWLATIPGCAIVLTVLSTNFIGDWLRDILDPTL